MAALHISDELAQTIQTEAQVRDLSIEEFLQSVMRRERTLADRRKIEQDQKWWFELPLRERAKYEGKFVAIHNQKLIDCDENQINLSKRIRTEYGKVPVLIMPAEGPKEIRIHSPRLEQYGNVI